jgi:hypothetical protein
MYKPVAIALALFCGGYAVPACSSTIIVTSSADSGAASLRNALANANAGDTIKFALPGATITLASTLTLTKNVTIDGSANTGLTISGDHAVQAFMVNAGVTATIKNLSIADSDSTDAGGIHNLGTLTVTGCTLSGNSGGGGGGILNDGTLTLTNNTFSGNSSGLGGGVRNASGSAAITSNTFVANSANYGGGIFVDTGAALTALSNNLFQGNTAISFGGSIGAAGDAAADHNLYWDNADSSGAQGINCNGCASNTNAVNANPLLGALADNAGPTRTFLPGAVSAAIGSGAAATCPATDQRGVARPQQVACDIGSVTVSTPCYVKAGAAGANSGVSWTDAFTDLQSALNDSSCVQVWVAKGTYRPTPTTDRSISFAIRRGLSLYGGFAGTETQINPRSAQNESILSGDIGVTSNAIDNSYHVVTLDGTTAAGTITPATNVIDGFKITGGNANGSVPANRGGGLYCDGSGNGHECSPLLNNLNISANSSADWAGGAFFDGESGKSNPLVTNSTFSGNTAPYGGGLMCFGQSGGTSSPTIGNVTFSGNSASIQGGALYNAALGNGTSSPVLLNVTFTGNVASDGLPSPSGQGGAIVNDVRAGGHSFPQLFNVILWGDQAPTDGEIHVNNDASGFVTTTTQTSILQGGCPLVGASCTDVITADPLLGTLANHGGLTPTVVPGLSGSAFDNGDDETCGGDPIDYVDQRGFARPFSQHCDIGAVEFNDRVFANGFEAP